MDSSEEIKELIRELSYQDHANDTNFAEQITQVFLESAFTDGTADQIRTELDALELHQSITDAEQLVVVHRVLLRLPELIIEMRSV